MCVAFAASGCATGISQSGSGPVSAPASPPASGQADANPSSSAFSSRETVVEAARALIGQPRIQVGKKRYPSDCTGLVRAVFDEVGIDLFSNARRGENGVKAIYRFAEAHGRIYTGGRAVAGDLVFFHDTYDRNRDGRRNDRLTHVALVERVEDDRTVWIIHRVRRGVVRYRMNLDQPDLRFDKSGRVLNDYLRVAAPGHRDVLTAQLFTAYATILPIDARPHRDASLHQPAPPQPSSEPSGDLVRLRNESFPKLGGP
jgi:hypothetical protein